MARLGKFLALRNAVDMTAREPAHAGSTKALGGLQAAIGLLLFALVSFAGASGYVYHSVRDNLVETIRANLNDEAGRNLNALQGRLDSVVRDVETWARSPFLHRMLTTQDPTLIADVRKSVQAMGASREDLTAFAVFDADGRILAALRDGWLGKPIYGPVQRAIAARQTYQSDVTDDTGVGVRGIEVGLPIFDEVDPTRVIGGVAVVIDWRAVSTFLAGLRVETRPQDATHRLVLTNREQEVLYHTGILDGGESEANGWDLLNGARVDALSVSVASTRFGGLRNPNWTLHQFVDEAVAFAPADRMGRTLILTSGLVIIVFGVATAFAIHRALSQRAASAARRIKALAEAAVEGIVICERDRIVQANASFCDLVGMGTVDLAGRSLLGFVRIDDRPLVRRLLERPEQATALVSVQPPSGSARPVELIRRAGTAGDGQTILALRDMTEKLAAQSRIEFLAHHDTLTGLSNRLHFNVRFADELDYAARTRRRLAVFCIDLDRFKSVNDTHGHHGGDALLRATGSRVAGFLAGQGSAARLGGDEFVAILPLEAGMAVEAAADALLLQLSQAVAFEGRMIETTASVGLAVYPDDGEEAEALLRAADLALYRSKQNGRGGLSRYDGELAETTRRRQRLQLDLVRAIEQETLSLVFQPQAVCATGEVSGFEVLLRWTHPEFGPIPPSLFVSIAEETNLILALGDWVLRTACAEAARWRRPLEVAVNISPVQIMSDGLAERIAAILEATGLDPRRLELEITENVLMRDIDRAQTALERLKRLGVRVAMDDFGTGYSSLAYLQRIAFDRIKIDRGFVANLETSQQARTIVRAAVSLARGLGLPVLAEGVETEGQLALLRAERCDGAQGYLIGRPLPIDHWRALVDGVPSLGDETNAETRATQRLRS